MKNARKILTAILICTTVLLILTACNNGVGKDHAHLFGEGFEFDGESHWRICECGERSEIAAHVLDEGVKEYGKHVYTCTVCGETIVKAYDTSEVASSYLGASTALVADTIAARYEYNSDGKLITVKHYAELSNEPGYYYGVFSEIVREVYEYDGEGRLLAVSVRLDAVADKTGAFGATGKVEEVMRFEFESDENGRPESARILTGITDVPLGKVTLTYGEDGVISKATISTLDQKLELTYKNGRLSSLDGKKSYEYTYTASGKIDTVSGDRSIQFTYKDGAVESITERLEKGTRKLEYTYNKDGTLKSVFMKSPTSDVTNKITYYEYDAEKRVVSITPCTTNLGKTTKHFEATAEYNDAGLVSKHTVKTFGKEETSPYTVEESTITYGENGKASRVEVISYNSTAPDKIVQRLVTEYEYTENGRNAVQSFTYYRKNGDKDELFMSSESDIVMIYDGDGRFLRQTVTSYEYDVNGKKLLGSRSTMEISRNEEGYTDNSVTYDYDRDTDSFIEKNGLVNVYDAEGALLSSTVYKGGSAVSKTEYGYGSDGLPYVKADESYNGDGTKERTEYDKYGDPTFYVKYKADGSVETEYKAEPVVTDGRVEGADEYVDGRLVSTVWYEYPEDGTRYVKKELIYHESGKTWLHYEYDKYGNYTYVAEYDENGIATLIEWMENSYNDYGYIISTVIYDKDRNAVREYTYQGDGEIHTCTFYDRENSLKLVETYRDGQTVGFKVYKRDYTTGEEIQLYSEMHYDGGGFGIYEYDELGQLLRYIRYDWQTDLTTVDEYRYGEGYNNRVGMICNVYKGEGTEGERVNTEEHRLGSNGQLYLYMTDTILEAVYDVPAERSVMIYREDGLLLSHTVYDMDGNVKSHVDYPV